MVKKKPKKEKPDGEPKKFLVKWVMEISDARDAVEAAENAFRATQDRECIVAVFEVKAKGEETVTVDLRFEDQRALVTDSKGTVKAYPI